MKWNKDLVFLKRASECLLDVNLLKKRRELHHNWNSVLSSPPWLAVGHLQITVSVILTAKLIKAEEQQGNKKNLLISAMSLGQSLRMVQPEAKPELNVFTFNRFFSLLVLYWKCYYGTQLAANTGLWLNKLTFKEKKNCPGRQTQTVRLADRQMSL